MDDTDPAGLPGLELHPLRDETVRQVIVLAAGLAFVALAAAVDRWATSPDAWRTAKMAAAKHTERACATAAGRLWAVAERARLAYEAQR